MYKMCREPYQHLLWLTAVFTGLLQGFIWWCAFAVPILARFWWQTNVLLLSISWRQPEHESSLPYIFCMIIYFLKYFIPIKRQVVCKDNLLCFFFLKKKTLHARSFVAQITEDIIFLVTGTMACQKGGEYGHQKLINWK